jgi:hypothetical protein
VAGRTQAVAWLGEAYSPVPQGGCARASTPVASVPAGDLLHSHPDADRDGQDQHGAVARKEYECATRTGEEREQSAPIEREGDGICPQMAQMDADREETFRRSPTQATRQMLAQGKIPSRSARSVLRPLNIFICVHLRHLRTETTATNYD